MTAQAPDALTASAVGGVAGGLAGLLASLPAGCNGTFSDRACSLPTVAKGFAAGNLFGTAFGASLGEGNGKCSRLSRFSLAIGGSVAGAGIGAAAVSKTHGYLRIGLTPIVQLAESEAAALMLRHCRDGTSQQFLAPRVPLTHQQIVSRDAAVLGLAGGYAALYVYFKHAWWSGEPATHWFVENDWDQNERDEDKFGHLFGGYQLTRIASEMLRSGGLSRERAAVYAALYAYAFQFQIEEWDGTQKMYGFSPGDLVADGSGASLAIAQAFNPKLAAIKPVWSYHPTLAYRRRNLPGHNGAPRATTDYAGQTYWFSTDVSALLPQGSAKLWPAILRVSPGYSITDYVDPQTGAPERAKRKILLSVDIDPSHLPGNNRLWRVVKEELSYLRIPGPTFQFTPSRKFFAAYY